MANEIITTLHPDQDPDTNLYPNVKKENIPSGSIDRDKLDSGVNSLLNNIGELHPSGTDTSTNILAFTTNKGIYIATDNGHWYYWDGTHYVDGGLYMSSEDYEKYYDILKSSQTLIEVDTSGKQVGYINRYGDISSLATYSYLDNITLKKGETIFVRENIISGDAGAIRVIAEYNTDFTPYIRLILVNAVGGDYIYTYTAPKDMKISITLLSSNEYECYILPNINTNIQDLLNGKINDNTLKLETLYDDDFRSLYTTSNNYFDKNKCYRARLVDITGLMNIYETTDYTTDYIDCSGKEKVYIWSIVTIGVQALAITFYDENYDYISGFSWVTNATIPNNAKYMKVGFNNTIVTNYNPMVMFDEETRPTSYIDPFKRSLKDFNFEYSMSKMFKTIGIIGDSLSSGVVYDENGNAKTLYNHSWLSTFCTKSGADPTYYSSGGQSTKSWLTSTYKTNFDNDPIKEAYFIALGTNDASQSYGIGNITDPSGTDSFVGYYKEIIDLIHTKSPNSVIFMLSMYGNTSDTYQTPYSNMIKQIADLYDYCFFVDYANNCPNEINLNISRVYTFYQENWHFTGSGYILVGETIYKLIDEIVNKNQSWFKWFVANL